MKELRILQFTSITRLYLQKLEQEGGNVCIFKVYSFFLFLLKGTLSGLTQFSANQSPLKMTKNVFYFTLKAFFVVKIIKFLS